MTTTYIVYEVGTKGPTMRAEMVMQAEAEAIACRYSRWYVVEKVETDTLTESAVVARSPDPEPAPYLQRATPKVSKLERARARMAKGVQ